MENKYLIIVDMQNDFISGSLGTREARSSTVSFLWRCICLFGGNRYVSGGTDHHGYSSTSGCTVDRNGHIGAGQKGFVIREDIGRVLEEVRSAVEGDVRI